MVLADAASSEAGGILHMFPTDIDGERAPVARPSVLLSRTTATVSESNIEYRIEQTFVNNEDVPLEGLFLFPLEKEKTPVETEIRINGVSVESSLLSAASFFPTLQELAVDTKDPSLLALAGKDILMVKPVNLGAHAQKTFRMNYKVPLSIRGEQVEVNMPLSGEIYSLGPVGELEIRVRFKMSRKVRGVLCPSNNISIYREAPHRCLVTAKRDQKIVREDFKLIAAFEGQDIDARLFTHKAPNRSGSFLTMISPPSFQSYAVDPPKDIVFLLDASGSMSRKDFELSRRAVIAGLEHLRPQDRFNVFTLSTKSARWRKVLVPASTENVMAAAVFVNSMIPEGGTDLANGLVMAMDLLSSRKRSNTIIITGDGRGTVGITDPVAISELTRRSNKNSTRICALIVGENSDPALLNKLSSSTKGRSYSVDAGEGADAAINRFYEAITPPQVSDIALELRDVTVFDQSPEPIPDITGTESVVTVGRYQTKTHVSSKAAIRGKIQGKTRTVEALFDFPVQDEGKPWVSEIWAMRQIAKLWEKARFKLIDLDMDEQITMLTEEYGFKAPNVASSPSKEDSNRLYWLFKTSYVPSDVRSDQFRRVGDKLFKISGTTWIDSDYKQGMPERKIEFLSNPYFALLKDYPQLGPCLSLGPEMVILTDQGVVKVVSDKAFSNPGTPDD